MKPVFLETGNVAAFRRAMAIMEDVRRGQPGLGVVHGRAGLGKTECAREYAVRTGAIYLRVLEDWTPRAMLASLCRELNDTEPYTIDRCRRMAFDELNRQRRIILVDEADRLKSVGHVEHLRDIHDETGAPVVLIGEASLYSKLHARDRLWSRVTQTVGFGPITAEDVTLFALKSCGLRIEPDAARREIDRFGGDFRPVVVDMVHLERSARASGTKTITLKMVNALPDRRPRPAKPKRRSHA